jgi:hypothetical protein
VKPEDTSSLLTAFALGVSALALIVSGCMAWRQSRLQGRLTAIEEERRGEEAEARRHARVTLSIPQPQIRKGDLVLTNEGPAGAWSVTFGVSSAVEGKQPPYISGLSFPSTSGPGNRCTSIWLWRLGWLPGSDQPTVMMLPWWSW